jgi:ubiquitin thioesterase protein OTUB1
MSEASETSASANSGEAIVPAADGESSDPMIGSAVSPSSLLDAYAANPLPGFIPGIRYLATKYPCMRRVKGDGNCFYRSFLFSYLEQLLRVHRGCGEDRGIAESERSRFRILITDSKELLVAIGYEVRRALSYDRPCS